MGLPLSGKISFKDVHTELALVGYPIRIAGNGTTPVSYSLIGAAAGDGISQTAPFRLSQFYGLTHYIVQTIPVNITLEWGNYTSFSDSVLDNANFFQIYDVTTNQVVFYMDNINGMTGYSTVIELIEGHQYELTSYASEQFSNTVPEINWHIFDLDDSYTTTYYDYYYTTGTGYENQNITMASPIPSTSVGALYIYGRLDYFDPY